MAARDHYKHLVWPSAQQRPHLLLMEKRCLFSPRDLIIQSPQRLCVREAHLSDKYSNHQAQMWTFTTKTGIILCIGRQSHDLHISKPVCIMRKLSKAALTTGAHCHEVSMWTCSAFQNNKQASILILKLKEMAVCIWNIICEKVHEECSSIGISLIIRAKLCSQWNKWLILCCLRGTRLLPILSGDLQLCFAFLLPSSPIP